MDGVSKKRHSMVRLVLELVEQSVVLVFLELKLAALEVKRNVSSAGTGAALLVLGGFLLLFSLLSFMATAIAALAIVLPVWLSALIVTVSLVALGAVLLFSGLGKLKHFTLLPKATVERIEEIGKKLKQQAEQHHREAAEAHAALQAEAAQREVAKAKEVEQREAAKIRQAELREAARAREAEQREEARARKAAQRASRRARQLTYAREKEEAREARRRRS